MSQPQPFVSVVVPVRNGAETIEACIQSLLAQDYPRDRYEVLIINNGSSDDTARRARPYPVILLHERRRFSSYAARNCGLQAAHGEVIAFTDADCIAERSWLTQLVAGVEDASVGAFAGRVVSHQPVTVLEQFADRR